MSPDARHDAQALLDVLPLASYIYELDSGEILGANAAFCKMLGYPQDRLVGKSVLELYPAENRAEVDRFIRSAPPEGLGERLFEAADGARVNATVRYRNSEFMNANREFVHTRLVVVITNSRVPAAEPAGNAS